MNIYIYRIYWTDNPNLDEAEITREVGLVTAQSLEDAKELYPFGDPQKELQDGGDYPNAIYVYEQVEDADAVAEMIGNHLFETALVTDPHTQAAIVEGIANAFQRKFF